MPLLITTSRRPCKRTRTLVKELNRVIPNSLKINRGKMSLNELREYMIRKGFNRLLIIETERGNPSTLQFFSLSEKGFRRNLVFKIDGLVLQLDKNQKAYLTHITEIKAENIDSLLLEILRYFLLGVVSTEKEVKKGFVKIGHKNEETVIGFVDQRERKIYPLIKGWVVSYEKI